MRNIFFLFIVVSMFSCRSLAPNRMFQAPDNYQYAGDSMRAQHTSYQLSENDRLEMHIFSNDGFKLVDVTSTNAQNPGALVPTVTYLVEANGEVKLPIIGKTLVKGLTISETEEMLQKKFSKYYNDPFVIIKVTNRHVLVFQGDGGHGTLVNLQNDNTTLLEALALSGGIPDNGRAYRIKIIRGDLKNPQVHLVDVSSLDGLKNSELQVLSNDIIYVEAAANYKQRIWQQITPIVGIITAVLLVINIVQK